MHDYFVYMGTFGTENAGAMAQISLRVNGLSGKGAQKAAGSPA
jgi:hypothetical protein